MGAAILDFPTSQNLCSSHAILLVFARFSGFWEVHFYWYGRSASYDGWTSEQIGLERLSDGVGLERAKEAECDVWGATCWP